MLTKPRTHAKTSKPPPHAKNAKADPVAAIIKHTTTRARAQQADAVKRYNKMSPIEKAGARVYNQGRVEVYKAKHSAIGRTIGGVGRGIVAAAENSSKLINAVGDGAQGLSGLLAHPERLIWPAVGVGALIVALRVL